MKRKLAYTLLSPLLAAGLLLSPLAAPQQTAAAAAPVKLAATAKASVISVYVDDKKLSVSAAPYTKNGVTFVPMRELFKALDASVTWEAKAQTIIVRKDFTSITLTIGNKTALINGKSVKLDAAPEIKNNTTFVPARFVAESLGGKVKWDNAKQSVRITTEEYEFQQEYEEYQEQLNNRPKYTPKQIVDMYDDSVVTITTNKALGSGIVIDDRYVLTNYHVIQDASSATITTVSGDELKVSGVVASSKNNDLAIVQTEDPIGATPVEVGYSSLNVKKGDKVVAIGSPLGLQNTVSDGLISNIVYVGGTRYIQTSAPIDHGSSGGALFSEYGELIGITSAGYTSQADLNFAVSSLYASILMEDLPEKPAATVKFLDPTLPDTLVGVSNEKIAELLKDQFGSLDYEQGTAALSNWKVTRDSQGWLVITSDIDPVFYTYYGGQTKEELRSWAINLAHELHRMLPNEKIQFQIYFDRVFGFEPRGFDASEVKALGDEKWQVRFPVLDMQFKDQLYIDLRD
ncbi:stalk domain-containing protein [Paenibacillus glycanilyticus]|uniref:stalk domain-containing protein n=1 Tax=Paenibacillus glycanilyticus TaxID=126569 RepID=UPI00203D314C|nr:stalk domain-containing protein [Paenibacillus glycanilyticus]MCM3628853.1 stalk domain-containing protein [Paenibacillus glycanilyticus]